MGWSVRFVHRADGAILPVRHVSYTAYITACASIVSCAELDPILSPDAATEASTLFACGATTCDSQNQYCRANVNPLDGGPDNCQSYPGKCTEDGGTATCACIQSCTCMQSGAAITVTCP
jgi:hypothetical protein